MIIETVRTRYDPQNTAAFMRSRERYGKLSNMTSGFPISANGLTFQSPEGLYQALKFPDHPVFQKNIAAQRSGMDAKRAAYRQSPPLRPQWDSLKVQAMAYTIALKLAQHPETFGAALRETGNLTIVETSFRDQFWGAKPTGDHSVGVNALGQILTAARNALTQPGGSISAAVDLLTADVPKDNFRLNGAPLPERP